MSDTDLIDRLLAVLQDPTLTPTERLGVARALTDPHDPDTFVVPKRAVVPGTSLLLSVIPDDHVPVLQAYKLLQDVIARTIDGRPSPLPNAEALADHDRVVDLLDTALSALDKLTD